MRILMYSAFLFIASMFLFAVREEILRRNSEEAMAERNATEISSVNSTLYNIAQKAVAFVVGKDAKPIHFFHSGNMLCIREIDGDLSEKRVYLGNVHSFTPWDNSVLAFIRDDAGECLVLWKGDEWNLASVNICGETMEVEWKKIGDFELGQELQAFEERALTAYREI